MSYTLQTGLDDLSRILNESSTQTTTLRKNNYNDAVAEFCAEYKWPFLIKEHTDTTVADTQDYDLPSDIREPGGLKEVTIGSQEYTPINWNERLDNNPPSYSYTVKPEYDDRQIRFTDDIDSGGDTITIIYYFMPSRVTTLTDAFDLPARVRTTIAYLAAEKVSRAKRQHATANNFRVLYDTQVTKLRQQYAERHTKLPRSFGHYLKHIGYRRTYND